jgi:hypothetical protein
MAQAQTQHFPNYFSADLYGSETTSCVVEPRRVELLSLTAPVKALLPSRNHPAPTLSINWPHGYPKKNPHTPTDKGSALRALWHGG